MNANETCTYDPSLTLAFKVARVFGSPIEAVFHPNGGGVEHGAGEASR